MEVAGALHRHPVISLKGLVAERNVDGLLRLHVDLKKRGVSGVRGR